jgi:hypothetical protein
MARSSAGVRVLGYRGVLGYWGIGVLGYWGIGVLGYWAIGLLGYWAIGVGVLVDFKPTIGLYSGS